MHIYKYLGNKNYLLQKISEIEPLTSNRYDGKFF